MYFELSFHILAQNDHGFLLKIYEDLQQKTCPVVIVTTGHARYAPCISGNLAIMSCGAGLDPWLGDPAFRRVCDCHDVDFCYYNPNCARYHL